MKFKWDKSVDTLTTGENTSINIHEKIKPIKDLLFLQPAKDVYTIR